MVSEFSVHGADSDAEEFGDGPDRHPRVGHLVDDLGAVLSKDRGSKGRRTGVDLVVPAGKAQRDMGPALVGQGNEFPCPVKN